MLTAPFIKLMLESVTTSSYFFLTKKKFIFIKPGNLSQYKFLMQWKSIFLSSADDLGTKSKQSLKETNVSNALQ